MDIGVRGCICWVSVFLHVLALDFRIVQKKSALERPFAAFSGSFRCLLLSKVVMVPGLVRESHQVSTVHNPLFILFFVFCKDSVSFPLWFVFSSLQLSVVFSLLSGGTVYVLTNPMVHSYSGFASSSLNFQIYRPCKYRGSCCAYKNGFFCYHTQSDGLWMAYLMVFVPWGLDDIELHLAWERQMKHFSRYFWELVISKIYQVCVPT